MKITVLRQEIKKIIQTILLIMAVVMFSALMQSCNKRVANPESKDSIFQRYGAEKAAQEGLLKSKEDEIAGIKKDSAMAKIQSGADKVYQKKLEKAEDELDKIKQRVRVLEIKMEERRLAVEKMYLKSLVDKKDHYLDPEEQKISNEKIDELIASFEDKENVPRGTKDKKAEKPKHAAEGGEE